MALRGEGGVFGFPFWISTFFPKIFQPVPGFGSKDAHLAAREPPGESLASELGALSRSGGGGLVVREGSKAVDLSGFYMCVFSFFKIYIYMFLYVFCKGLRAYYFFSKKKVYVLKGHVLGVCHWPTSVVPFRVCTIYCA